jgi:hypothetical protein
MPFLNQKRMKIPRRSKGNLEWSLDLLHLEWT